MRKNELNIVDVHSHLLNLIREVHNICERNGIVYYLAYGTLLGAYRHNGFIPWDDDMDILVPIEQYNKFITVMQKELPKPIVCCLYKTHSGVIQPWAKVSDFSTMIEDKCVYGLSDKEKLGVNIDIFPLVQCQSNDDKSLQELVRIRKIYQYIYTESTTGSYIKHIIKAMLQGLCPVNRYYFLNRMWTLSDSVEKGNHVVSPFVTIYGSISFPKEWFGVPHKHLFEGIELNIPRYTHEILLKIYGDYMQLPPIEKRKSHLSKTTYRDV